MATILKANWQGKDYVFDFESITSREYKVIKRHTGLKIGQFEQALSSVRSEGIDPEVVDCLLWLFLKRDGQNVDPETLDDYSPAEFIESLDIVKPAEASEAEAPLAPADSDS